MALEITECLPTSAAQDSYLTTYSEDSVENIGLVLHMFKPFLVEGEIPETTGPEFLDTTLDISSSLEATSFRVYDTLGVDFSGSISGTEITIQPGAVVLNNVLFNFTTTNTLDVDSDDTHITPFGFETSNTNHVLLVAYFDENITTDGALLGFVPPAQFDPDTMVTIWLVQVVTLSGSITSIDLLYEYVGVSRKVIHGPVWKNIVADGGVVE